MDKEHEKLIRKILICDIHIKIAEQKAQGMIINEEIINIILKDLKEQENG